MYILYGDLFVNSIKLDIKNKNTIKPEKLANVKPIANNVCFCV